MASLFNSPTRRQASMYLRQAHDVEALRCEYNPAQSRLIPAHVTLCREDEVTDWTALGRRIEAVIPIDLTLGFGNPVRDGNLVFLPAVTGLEQFEALRHTLLFSGSIRPRPQLPHITIIHPRNGHCSDAIFHEICRRVQPFTATFHQITLIEQTNGGPWVRFAEFGTDVG